MPACPASFFEERFQTSWNDRHFFIDKIG